MSLQQRWVGGLLVCAAAASLAGCGGGASAMPTVRFKPSKAGEAAPVEGAVAAAPTEGAATPAAGGIGALKGRVVYQGSFKPLALLYDKGAAPKDPAVCGLEAAPNESVVVNDGGLANVFIYLAKAPKGAPAAAVPEPFLFDQKHCVFKPHASIVRTGQVVKVLNSDAVAHNTHTYPSRNSPFNQTISPNETVGVNLTYGKAENQPIQVGCDIHPWMVAFQLPIDHPYATVSAADGTFEIKDLPSGTHEFKVWHEKGGQLEKALKVVIKADETTEIEIPVAATKLGRFEGPAPKVIQLSSAR